MFTAPAPKPITIAIVSLLTAAIVHLSFPLFMFASSHREAPLISNDPQADNTDLYAFVSPDKPDTVTLIVSFILFEEPREARTLIHLVMTLSTQLT